MLNIQPLLLGNSGNKKSSIIFLSGSGSNAEKILLRLRDVGEAAPFEVVALFTDNPLRSRARELGKIFSVPVIENDIREFYRGHGVKSISIATERGRELRELWTDEVRGQLSSFAIDFAVFAGFVPLTNITNDFLCLNVHPGDLTYLRDGSRYLVGLHTVPIERAIFEDLSYMRSSVIVAEPYSGRGEDMDSGVILGVSQGVDIDLLGHDVEELRRCLELRATKRPRGGWDDVLATVARHNLNLLKKQGDWVVFPQVVFDFAAGRFGRGADGKGLFYRGGKGWLPVETVIYGVNNKELILANNE